MYATSSCLVQHFTSVQTTNKLLKLQLAINNCDFIWQHTSAHYSEMRAILLVWSEVSYNQLVCAELQNSWPVKYVWWHAHLSIGEGRFILVGYIFTYIPTYVLGDSYLRRYNCTVHQYFRIYACVCVCELCICGCCNQLNRRVVAWDCHQSWRKAVRPIRSLLILIQNS